MLLARQLLSWNSSCGGSAKSGSVWFARTRRAAFGSVAAVLEAAAGVEAWQLLVLVCGARHRFQYQGPTGWCCSFEGLTLELYYFTTRIILYY